MEAFGGGDVQEATPWSRRKLSVCVCVCNWEAGGKVCRWEGMQGRGVERGGGERTACMKLQTKDRKW